MLGLYKKRFYFSSASYFDMVSNTIVDTQNGTPEKYTPISGSERSVLKKLIEAYPHSVSKEHIAAEICPEYNEAEARRVIDKLRKHHSQLNLWIPRARQGEYRLLAPAIPERTNNSVVRPAYAISCTLKNTGICTRPHFVQEARADVFHRLDEAFENSHVVFLQGIGGIGKSEIAKHWAIQKKRAGIFDTVVFAQLNADTQSSNVLSLITNDTVFVIGGEFHYRDDEETVDAYFQRKLAKIKQITDERTLIIIDNYDIDDPQLALLFTGPYRLLVTTRNIQTGYDFPLIRVSEIQSLAHLKEIFIKNLDGARDDIRRDDPYIEKLFALVSNHTLTVEILSKALINSADTPETLYRKILSSEQHMLMRNVDSMVDRNFSEEPLSPYECVRLLFNLSRLEQDKDFEYKSQVLVFMAAMPTRGIELSLFNKWSDNRIIRAKNSLVRMSWLRQDTVNDVTLVSMHPLIREIVWGELEPSPDKCSTIISNFTREDSTYIDYLYHQPKSVKDMYEQPALSLLSAFPIQNINWFDFHVKLHRIFHTCANFTFSLNTATKLKELLELAQQTDTWRYGFINYRLGSVYSFILRERVNGAVYFHAALKQLEETSNTHDEKMWLAFIYRELASLECRDEYLFQTHKPSYITQIEHYINHGEKIVNELKNKGFTNTNIDLYYGTLCVWRSRIEIYHGNLDLATTLIDTAEAEFIRFGYPNTLDKAAVADVRALIYALQGAYNQQIACIKESTKVFEGGFGKHHRASILRAIQLAIAYRNNQQPDEAIRVLKKYQKIAMDMLGEDAPLTRKINSHLKELGQV